MTVLLALVVLAGTPEAGKLNAAGFKLYQAGKYEEALEKFEAAVAEDERHALAHYNLAATLGVFRKKNQVCEHDAYRSNVLDHLERAVQLDPRRKQRMQEDADFDSVRDTFRYQKLLGLSVKRDAKRLLEAITWYGPAPGAFGNTMVMTFKPEGRFSLALMDLDEEGAPKWDSYAGRVVVKGVKVTLTLERALKGKTVLTGELTDEGVLRFEGLEPLTDQRSECEA